LLSAPPFTYHRRRAVKADLHLHSKFSDRSPEWIFRRAGLPASYSEPRELYRLLRERGMDFVTITDNQRIDGCLAIAELPGVFISEQIGARFPEDRCEIQLLVWGLNEAQHRDLLALRENIYDVQRYLGEAQLAHSVAHPLRRADDRLGAAHIEKLVLLFRHFETINGLRDARLGELARELFTALTPEKIDDLANKHGLAPTHAEAWKKAFTGGSDDHGGMSPGCAWTECADATSAADFLAAIRAGRCEARGRGGCPLTVSHGLYNNLRCFIAAKFSSADSESLIGKAFSRFMEGEDPTEFSWTEKLGFIAQGIASGKIFELAKPANASLWKQFAATFSESDVKSLLARETDGIAEPERRAFVIANFFANRLAFRFFTTFVRQLSSGNIIEAIREVSMLAPILATLAPYLYAFASQMPNRSWLREVSIALTGRTPAPLANTKRGWFTDTLEDVNGVTNTIRKLTAAVVADGHELTVVTSRSVVELTGIPIKNFAPIGEFELPEYELQKLSFPPILEIIDYIERESFTELIISTPGPIGLTALLAAKMLGLRTSGIYHTDFPQYVRILTDDSMLETLTWKFMKWFYAQLDVIFVNSESYRRAWIDRGIPAGRLRILPRGLDTSLFQPSRRAPGFWEKHGIARGRTVLLYVGRVSKEKDLDVIVSMWGKLNDAAQRRALVFVGDGPYTKELRALLPEAVFTGYLAGIDLARAFASADVFLFPSTTDTFGNVILEALACGVPCIVSDRGGPKDLIAHGSTGFVTRALDVEDFTRAVRQLLADPALRQSMSVEAHRSVLDRDWGEAGRRFWAETMD
jgi:glycosyltransferase involved in cell wall biosynthesis